MREEVNRIGTDGATNWLRAKLLRVPVRGAPSKSARRSCSRILWDASRYFVVPEGTGARAHTRAHTHTRTHSLTEKWVAAGSFKVSTRFLGVTGEGVRAGSEQGRKNEVEGGWRRVL